MSSTRRLGYFDSETLLRWFYHHLRMEDRYALMAEFPHLYNRWVGAEIVKVVKTHDEEVLSPRPSS
jgi:hypothetical protein